MSAAVPLAELRARVRELATLGDDSALDTAELDRAIMRWLRRLYDKLIETRGDDYYATSATFTTVNGQTFYDKDTTGFPKDLYVLLSAEISDGSNHHTMSRYNMTDLSALKNVAAHSSIGGYRYRLSGEGIDIRTPAGAYTVTLHYIPSLESLEEEGEFNGWNGWEDWACYGAAADLLISEESFEQAQALRMQMAVIDGNITALAGNRDAGQPAEVVDLRRDFASRWFWTSYRDEY